MPGYLRHLTLNTGDQRDSYRDEVSDEVIALLRPLLERAVTGGCVEIPGLSTPCTMTGGVGRGRALLVTISGPETEGGILPPLLQVAVAGSSLASATLWREWVKRERDDRTPTPPWCVSRIMVGSALHMDVMAELGDVARCIAWAWLEPAP